MPPAGALHCVINAAAVYNLLDMAGNKISRILSLLQQAYGRRVWQPGRGPVEVLVQTILSQNTSDTNSQRAYDNLLADFADWDAVAEADPGRVAFAIKSGGLGAVKAGYIIQALRQIKSLRGGFDLSFLRDMTMEQARQWLTALPGVGMKTASCVLLFALGMPSLPVDTHVFRVAGRLGLLPAKASADQAHLLLEKVVPAGDVYPFHILLIEHGRKTCKSQRPLCAASVSYTHLTLPTN